MLMPYAETEAAKRLSNEYALAGNLSARNQSSLFSLSLKTALVDIPQLRIAYFRRFLRRRHHGKPAPFSLRLR